MVYEYAQLEFGGGQRLENALGITPEWQRHVVDSVDNLSPLQGGRHAQ